ncbi:MAG: 50S ribosomal protein L10 [Mycoplasmataceae bacterium RV_VA103A]|nr:MAG: 50S ribosomal protein L10 [Mycoplasmataceae bacterium RV_VA103A]
MSATSQKQVLVQDIKNNFQQARAVIFYNFHHTENRELFKLKKELKKVGGHWKVYKNSLVEKALSDYSLELKQANAFIFCQEDEYKPLNILNQFAKRHSNIKRFQGGIYEQKLVAHTLLEKWANLPSKEILINTLCYYLNYQTRRLVNILEKIQSSQTENK